jgi:serine protease AprX
VLNLSLGTDSKQSYRLSPLNFAVERAWDSGLVVVASASNSGPGAGTVAKPGDDPLVVTVGATDDLGTVVKSDDLMAGFSGEGPTADGFVKPDVVAPGRSLISLRAPASKIDDAYPTSRIGTGYFRGSGTSFSTAITSGAAALLLQDEPALTPDQVKHRLMSTATPGPVRKANVDGAGSLDAYAAAHADTLSMANRNVSRAAGTGLLALDRGTISSKIQTDTASSTKLAVPVSLNLTTLTGERTAQNKQFDGLQYTTSEWTGTRWYTSQWSGTRWYTTVWDGTRWYGTRWYDNSWSGSRWYAIAWE